MRHLRRDYDWIQPAFPGAYDVEQKDIPEDEPVFFIRCKSPSGPQAVHGYAETARLYGADDDFVAAVHEWAEHMERYRLDHYADRTRPPDADDEVLRRAPFRDEDFDA